MHRGKVLEERVIRPLMSSLGINIDRTQEMCEIRCGGRVVCTGHIDGIVQWNGMDVLVEIKTINPNLFDSMSTIYDMLDHPWLYKWALQVLLYCRAYSLDAGMILLDDCLGHLKCIPFGVAAHETLVDDAIHRCRVATLAKVSYDAACDAIGDCVVRDIESHLPPHHDDAAHCRRCRHCESGACIPPMMNASDGIRFVSSPQIEEALAVRESTHEAHNDFNRADRVVSGFFKPQPDGVYLVGPFRVDVSSSERAGYTVEPGKVQRRKVERLAGEAAAAETLQRHKAG